MTPLIFETGISIYPPCGALEAPALAAGAGAAALSPARSPDFIES